MQEFLPRDKYDTERALALVALGYPSVAPALPAILEWVQDINWPVAGVLAPFLATIGAPLAPHVRIVLATDDDYWKWSVLAAVVAHSPELARALRHDLTRLAQSPTDGERAEGLEVQAKEILIGA